MRGNHISGLMLTALVSMSTATLSAQAQDPCCEMKIVSPADAPARLTVTITNVGGPVVGVARTDTYYDYRISLTTDTGGEVGLTELGKRLRGQPWGYRRTYEELRAGESLKEELDLSERFELKPGTYKVTLTRDVYIGGKGGAKISLVSKIDFKVP
jgi:hypothetical protein